MFPLFAALRCEYVRCVYRI